MIPIKASDVKVEVAIVVVIDEGEAHDKSITAETAGFSRILECAVLLVVLQQEATVQPNDQIDKAIIVIVAGSTTGRVKRGIKSSLARDIFKFAAA